MEKTEIASQNIKVEDYNKIKNYSIFNKRDPRGWKIGHTYKSQWLVLSERYKRYLDKDPWFIEDAVSFHLTFYVWRVLQGEQF